MSVTPEQFKEALRRWVSGVTVVTTTCDGMLSGMTVSAFSSVSLFPPLILIALGNESHTVSLIEKSRVFGLNMLAAGQTDLSTRFAEREPCYDEKFADLAYQTGMTGSPLFLTALAALDCRVVNVVVAGDHTVFFGDVVQAHVSNRDPLLYYDGAYQQILYGRRTKER